MGRRPRRPVEWHGNAGTAQRSSSGVTASVIETAAYLEENYTKPTIMRIVGDVHVRAGSGAPAVTEVTVHRLGIICTHTAPTDVDGNLEDEWLWTGQLLTYRGTGTLPYWNGSTEVDSTYGYNVRQVDSVHIDTGTSRIVRPGCALYLVWETIEDVGSAQTPVVYWQLRWLVKE